MKNLRTTNEMSRVSCKYMELMRGVENSQLGNGRCDFFSRDMSQNTRFQLFSKFNFHHLLFISTSMNSNCQHCLLTTIKSLKKKVISICVYIYTTLSVKTLSAKIFVGKTFSSVEIFVTS